VEEEAEEGKEKVIEPEYTYLDVPKITPKVKKGKNWV